MRIIIMIFISITACTKNNFIYNNKYKNDVEYYFNNVDKLDKNIISYIIEKAEEGDNKALFLYVCLFKEYPNNKELSSKIYLLKNLNKLIDYLNSNNCFKILGGLYHQGIKGELNSNASKAIEYFNKAIDRGDFSSAFNLGLLYHYGIEGQLEPNISKAVEYYSKAIDIGNAKAANNLGTLYYYGVEGQLEPNISRAIECYNKAIDMGNTDAAYNLGLLYCTGVKGELEPDAAKAIECCNKAIDMGNTNAAYNLGLLYHYGVEGQLAPNISKAIEYYNRAMDIGNPSAANNLGVLYHYGVEGQLEPNIDKAIEYYNRAMDIGNPKAAKNLGLLYHYGVEGQLEPSISNAIEYYNKAIDMGGAKIKISRVMLDELYNELIVEKLNMSIDKAVRCVFELYDKYNYKNNIIKEIFTLNDNTETSNRFHYKLVIIKYISNLYNKYKNYIVNKMFISPNDAKKDNEQDDIENKDIMETYVNNIKECYGIILGEKIANDSNSTVFLFKHNSISNNLFVSYSYICEYLENLVDVMKYFNNHNFMINCISLKDKSSFNNNESDYLNVLNIQCDDYICLSENEGYNKLLDIINRKEKLISHINKAINNTNNNNDLCRALKEIINIENQLYDILVHTSSLRNESFINKYRGLFKH